MYNRYLSEGLTNLGHQVTVISSRTDNNVPAFESVDGIDVHRLHIRHFSRLHRLPVIGKYMRSLTQWFYSCRVARKIKKISKISKIDVVEIPEVGAEGFCYLQAKKHIPTVIRCHTPTFVLNKFYTADEMNYDTRMTERMEKYCIRHADIVTAPSNDMANTIIRECGLDDKTIHVIPNLIDVDIFSSIPHILLDERDHPVILHVGRLERVKGINLIVEAIPQVLDQVPNAEFVFIGAARSDEKSRRWKDQLLEAGGNQVKFLGFLEFEDMLAWYGKSDIVVVPSLNYESFSYTCSQAMAAGLPVVASRIGGIPETLVEGKAGILIELGDVSDFINAIITLLNDRDLRLRMGQTGSEKAKKDYSVEKVTRQTISVYEKASKDNDSA